MAVGGRHEGRERALGLLYEADAKGVDPEILLAQLPVEPDAFAVQLAAGVGRCRVRIDELITRFSRAWALDRMPVIDRLLLELATYELLERADTPVAVIIDEAVELAKAYSTDDSSRFVNGVLGSISAELRPPG